MPPKPAKKENVTSSPVKATLATPPRPGIGAFFFHNPDGARTHGLTPNGKTLTPLNPYEGSHHRRVRAEADPKLTVSGDYPLGSPYKNKFEPEMLRLDAQLVNLKARSNHDYLIYQKNKSIDLAHFDACIRKIKENIQQIRTCYELAPDPEAFLTELNQRIAEGAVYNPFGLQRIYCPKEGYKIGLAEDVRVFQSPIEQSLIPPPPPVPAALAASTEKRPLTVFGGLYDGIDDIDVVGGPPPCKRRQLFASKDVHTVATAQEDPDLADLATARIKIP